MRVQVGVLFLVLSLSGVSGWGSDTKGGGEATEVQAGEMGEGYALLYSLVSSEKDVAKLLIIKKETSELRELIKEIADRSKEAHKFLQKAGKRDDTLDLKDAGLPKIEIATRERIAKVRGKELLKVNGTTMELLLLLSQNEALTYGTSLAAVLAEGETDPSRKEFLGRLSADFAELQGRVVRFLAKNYG